MHTLHDTSHEVLLYEHNRWSIFHELRSRGATAQEIAQAVNLPLERVEHDLNVPRRPRVDERTRPAVEDIWTVILDARQSRQLAAG